MTIRSSHLLSRDGERCLQVSTGDGSTRKILKVGHNGVKVLSPVQVE